MLVFSTFIGLLLVDVFDTSVINFAETKSWTAKPRDLNIVTLSFVSLPYFVAAITSPSSAFTAHLLFNTSPLSIDAPA